LVTPRMEI